MITGISDKCAHYDLFLILGKVTRRREDIVEERCIKPINAVFPKIREINIKFEPVILRFRYGRYGRSFNLFKTVFSGEVVLFVFLGMKSCF